ncbi:hypothetical protein KO02_11505 [Sphingobacterium sp. ML3W]|uniref:MauE/DoxX family redox-associated membrane protein n=1 Tax=Sphingobacterium sp. ML3W TaxID=1538644 RepID=UPI0004F59D7D|nr:MauE/DoxX family redox-associated membrane protein [Sphingobacterium sp. ML3W]AIM37246.1 hypothetical protein KO02_11505 [Sphingobacterium sp. ML3W]
MKNTIKNITTYSISIFLIIFWLFVGLEKATSWKNFELSLHQQPLPVWSIGIIFWLIPLIEILTGFLLIFRGHQLQRWGYWGSILLLTAFTIFIGLGVLDVYEKTPCHCSSIFNDISWEQHLVINMVLLMVSIVGLYLTQLKPTTPNPHREYRKRVALFLLYATLSAEGTVQKQQLAWADNVFVVPEKMQPYPSR